MAQIDNATLVVSTGRFYTATTGTEFPADILDPGTTWKDVGHTSIEDVFGFESEGGEATNLGTLQAPQHRTKYAARIESFTLSLQQFDVDSLKLFYGANSPVVEGRLRVPSQPVPTTCAFLAVLQDGEDEFVFYAPRAEVFRADNFQISDTDSLASLPISVKPLQHGTNNWLYEVTPKGEVTP